MDDTDIVARFNAAITAADIGALAGLITDDHRFVDPAGNEIAGREEVLAAWRGFFQAFPGYRNTFAQTRADGGSLCLMGASHCSDPRLDGPALWRATLQGGKLAAWEVFDDTADTRRALGFMSG